MSSDHNIEADLANYIFNNSIACTLDGNFLIKFASNNFKSLIGYTDKEVQGNFLITLKPPEQSDDAHNFILKTINHGEKWVGELQIPHKDGHILCLDTTITPIKHKNQSKIFIASFIDITHQKALITRLKQRAHRQSLIAILGHLSLNNPPISDLLEQTLAVICGSLELETGIILELSINGDKALARSTYNTKKTTPGKTVIPVNRHNMLGYTLKSEQPVTTTPDTQEKRFEIPKYLLREQSQSITCTLIGDRSYPLGILTLLSSKIFKPNLDDEHFLQSVCNILAEAINRKNMEMSIKYEQELSSKYLDVAEFLIIVIDTDEKILLTNKYASKTLGYSQHELTEMNLIDTFIPENIKDQYRSMFLSLLGKQQYDVNITSFKDDIIPIINKNKDIRYIKWKSTLLYNEDGEVTSILSSGDDITEQLSQREEQKNLEKKLHQAQKMEAVGMLAGGIAHDFNNILASILGFSDLIIENLKPEDKALLEFVTHIKTSGTRAKDIIEQMQSINLQDDTSIKATPLPELLNNTLKILRSAMPSTIKLDVNVQKNIPPVNINSSTFNQLIMKLLINSRNALSGYGNITLDLSTQKLTNSSCTTCGTELNSEYVVLTIHDDGPGLSLEDLTEAFKQITSASPDSGIAYANKITHDCNGHIIILSRQLKKNYINNGTSIQLLFNISHRQQDNGLINIDTNPLSPTSTNLMIIDDDNSVASYLGELFKNIGFNVDVFCDSVEALSHFKNNTDHYHLIITDQTMPALTGTMLAQEILSINAELPIILCTGQSDKINKEKSLELKIKGFVKKPVNSTELLHLVYSLLT